MMSKKKKNRHKGGSEPPATAQAAGPGETTPVLKAPPALPLVGKIVFISVAVVCAALDIGSKYAVFDALDARVVTENGMPRAVSGKIISVVGETLRFHAALNRGAVFGILQGRWLFLVVFTVLALGIIGWVMFKSRNVSLPLIIGLSLVCAGAMGNLWDRFLYNGVRDFILFTSPLLEPFLEGGHWPTFNLADAWIVIGIPLIAVGDWLRARRESAESAKSGHPAGA